VYYVINLNYPTPYGVLDLTDRFCLVNKKSSRHQAKKKAKKEESTFSMKKFLNVFDKFCEESQTSPSSNSEFSEK
jgi:hypothetical protein